jgi:hypothetical protein
MNEMIIQPNSRGVPTDMVLLFVCSKPHSQRRQQFGSRHFQRQAAPTPSQRRQQFGSRHFQRQAAGCANTIQDGANFKHGRPQTRKLQKRSKGLATEPTRLDFA